MSSKPLVSVVTPVYNGSKFLAECIESVQQQSYDCWEHVIIDNASTDETRAVAERAEREDSRIRVVSQASTVSMVENWNRAMAEVSPRSAYCKVLHADDLLYPSCLEKMVDLAERHPSAGIVGTLRLRGGKVECGGLPLSRELFSGQEVARLFLSQKVFSLAPTADLVRSDLVRRQAPFYPAQYLHTDIAAYLNLLDETDFGFIHEVLFFSRTHEDSVTATIAEVKQTLTREWLFLLRNYGPRYFDKDELAELEQVHLRRWYRLLVRGALTGRGREFVAYHMDGLREIRQAPTPSQLGLAMAAEVANAIVHPRKTCRHLYPAAFGKMAAGRDSLASAMLGAGDGSGRSEES